MKQNKINWKEFRYLSKIHVRDYHAALNRLAPDYGNLEVNTQHFIEASFYQEMRCSSFDFVDVYFKLGKAVDIAWLIFQIGKLKKVSSKQLFKDHDPKLLCNCNNGRGVFPPHFFGEFFRFRNYREWHEILEFLLINYTSISSKTTLLNYSDIIMPVTSLLCKLPIALKTTQLVGGIEVCSKHENE